MVSFKAKKASGFTIIELLVVIVVIAILAGLVVTSYIGIQQRARDTERQTDIRDLATALELFRTDRGYYPKWSGAMNNLANATTTLGSYVENESIYKAPRSTTPYSIVNSNLDGLTPQQYYYYPVNDPRTSELDPQDPRSYNLCPWTAGDTGCKGFFLAWRSEATNELHITQSLQR